MKTLSILFSEPNVFNVLPEWPDVKHCKEYKCWHNPDRVKQCGCGLYNEYDAACEQSKANAIRIENIEICKDIELKEGTYYLWNAANLRMENLRPGDIFQVEGFEYEVTRNFNAMCDDLCDHCKYHDLECSKITKVSCVLKLAKEEEPKETPNKRIKDHTSEWLLKHGNTNKSEWNLALEAVVHNLKLRGFNEQDYNGKILFDEIEKLKK
jgi:hypothetical protein